MYLATYWNLSNVFKITKSEYYNSNEHYFMKINCLHFVCVCYSDHHSSILLQVPSVFIICDLCYNITT